MVVSLASELRLPLLACMSPSTACTVALDLLPLTWLVASSLAVAAASTLLGPLAVSAATTAWVLATPVDREDLLTPDLTRVVIAGIGLGFVSGTLLWVLAGGSPVWIAACTATGALAVLSAVLAQQGEGWHTLKTSMAIAKIAWALLGALAFADVISPTLTAVALAALPTLLAGRAVLRARADLATMSRHALARRSQTRAGLVGAVSGADVGLALDILALNLGGTGSGTALRSTCHTGWRALAGYEVRRVARRSPRLLWGLSGAIVAMAFIPIHQRVGLALACLALVPALGLILSSLRAVLRSRGLARALGLGRGASVSSLTSGAALAAAAWAVACSVVLIGSDMTPLPAVLLAWSVGASGLAGAIRWAASPPPDFAHGIIATDLGPIPVTAISRITSGFGVAFAMAVLLLVGTPVVACAVPAGLALAWSIIKAARPGTT
ncbi:MAG TPA: DUF6297 family protein [Arachnia sp.]|nr:DUF6297 family protein [Arachnia sp.]HMT84823.1 DUF6297 family protein [Arachnia sp.]